MAHTTETYDFQAIAGKLPRATSPRDGREYDWADPVGPKKQADDSAAAQRFTAWALIFNGELAGRIIWDYGAGMRTVCTIYPAAGPLSPLPAMTGTASGGGYCKRSAAFDDALYRAGVHGLNLSGRGMNVVQSWLESIGYVVAPVL